MEKHTLQIHAYMHICYKHVHMHTINTHTQHIHTSNSTITAARIRDGKNSAQQVGLLSNVSYHNNLNKLTQQKLLPHQLQPSLLKTTGSHSLERMHSIFRTQICTHWLPSSPRQTNTTTILTHIHSYMRMVSHTGLNHTIWARVINQFTVAKNRNRSHGVWRSFCIHTETMDHHFASLDNLQCN